MLCLMIVVIYFLFFSRNNSSIKSTGTTLITHHRHTPQLRFLQPWLRFVVVRDGNRRLMQDIDCGGLCKDRCSLHSRPNVCARACGTCCVRCKCVPPGTSGNRELCGKCYTDMTTHGNKTKCP
ncbi:hypothetical protein PVL29_022566 [Vitis rotundifolia]|uniref:Snakin-2 n=1 Tax=Vitis rotundifolia TaxID=103349 RepID=A0AA39DA97_VITRO|nr:hypothetical protein PVL29_022566 [Vitis rotundifolia]